MVSVAFKMETHGGLGVVEGRVKAFDNRVVLEYRLRDNILGTFKAKPRRVELPYAEIDGVRFRRRRFAGSILELELTNVHVAERIPGSEVGTLPLKIDRKSRDDAERVATYLNKHLSEYRLLDGDRALTDEEVDLLFDDFDD